MLLEIGECFMIWKGENDKDILNTIFISVEGYFDNITKYGLEEREGQRMMALSVVDAIDTKTNLIVEAGVGIGKSFAYLIPLIYYYRFTGKSFIISTSTIALQEQLEKDIDKLCKIINIPINVVIAKGMNNFLCKKRLESFAKFNSKEVDYILKHSNNGVSKQDRSDFDNVKDGLWKNVNVDTCIYNKCEYYKTCKFFNIREQMKNNNGCIICNHDLLIEDLSRPNKKLMKPVEIIVCDEAHNLESKVRSANTIKVELNNIQGTLMLAISELSKSKNNKYNIDVIINDIKLLEEEINKKVLKKIEELQEKFIMIEDCNGLPLEFDNTITNLSKTIYNNIKDISTSLDIINVSMNRASRNIYLADLSDHLSEDLQEKSEIFNRLSIGNEGGYIYWIERKNNKNHIYSAPKNINVISNRLFFQESNCKRDSKVFVFTSATLTTDGESYNYFMDNIGASLVKNEKCLTCDDSFPSPYNYDENTLLYCPPNISNPKDRDNYLTDITKKIEELVKLTNGKAMVLFTSKYDMNYVYNKLKDSFEDIIIYIQNDGSSQNKIKEQFKTNINSVLFSTGTFWEGIDIKGESLSNLIIARLPFPIVDPIMEYKKNCYKDGFDKVYIPEMLIKLKQGVGRLIRGYDDKGVITILDSRLSNNKKYLSRVKEALPIKNITTDIKEVEKFIKAKGI